MSEDKSIPQIEKVFPTTPAQMEIWLACKMGGKDANKAYNESVSINLKGDLSVKFLQEAFLKIIERHDSMRAVISPNGKSLIIFESYSLPIRMRDISNVGKNEKDVFLKKHLEQASSYDFNLVQGPLYVLDLIKLEEKEFLLTFTGHHLIFDGWSLGVMLDELAVIYSELVSGKVSQLPKADLLSEYTREFYNLTRKPHYKRTKEFWKEYLSNPVPRLDLPIDNERTKSRTYKSEVHKSKLKAETFNKIKALGLKLNSSLNLTLLAIFEIFLNDWTNQNDVIVGLPVAGQIGFNKPRLIGHCVSLLPLRSKVDKNWSFSEYLKIRREDYFSALEYGAISFGDMLQNIKLERDPSRIPLVPVTFNIDTGMGNDLKFEGLDHDVSTNPKAFANFELILNLFETSEGHVLDWTYNSNLFKRSSIEIASERYFKMIDLFLEQPDEKISKIISSLNSELQVNNVKLDDFQPLGELIKNQLTTNKDKVAVVVGTEEYTYENLNTLVNSISNQLLQKGVGPGKIVGVHLERNIELVASALAVIQIGACYMPVDTEFPEERVKFMLNDVNVKAFISDQDSYLWGDLSNRRIKLDKNIHSNYNLNGDVKSPESKDPLFIVYTSGSTGNPKGVVLSQQNISYFLGHFKNAPGLIANDRVIGLTSISFDMSFLEIVLPFVFGASLHLFDKFERRDPREIIKVVNSGKITKLFATPSHLKSILEYGLKENNKNLTIISAGEPLQLALAQSLVKSSLKVFNIYGPTETTIFTNIKEITFDTEVVTIGKPVKGTDIFLLDEMGNIVKGIDELGEVYIGGKGVGIGYLNREELTKERFLKDPFPNVAGRYYKTGDLAVWTKEGELICKGRIDHQVKIRGQRVELGEIENMIALENGVKDVIVEKITDENGDDGLVAIVSLKNNDANTINSSVWIDTCKKNLSKFLSSFMVPGQFVFVDNFQLNQNGKIDRKAARELLLAPVEEAQNQPIEASIEKGISETVRKVKELWEEILVSKNLGLDADFFQVGGHSLLAVDLISKIEKKFDLNLPLSFLFEHSTINSISNKLDQLLLNNVEKSGCLVKIKDGSPNKILFFIHGVGLNPLEIKTLNKYMDDDQTIWGLQSPAILNSEINPIDNIEDIAEFYIKEIKKNGFVGPYKFLGNSIGGQIAFEMAKQLLRKGDNIEFLGMMDTTATLFSNIPKTLTSQLKRFVDKMIFELKFFFENPIYYISYRIKYLKEKIDKFKNPIAEEDLGNLKSRIRQIESVNMEAWKKYKHEPIDVNITLFIAKKKTFYVSDFKTYGWDPYVNNIYAIQMPGEHANMLKSPNGLEFCKSLQNKLNKSNS